MGAKGSGMLWVGLLKRFSEQASIECTVRGLYKVPARYTRSLGLR